jgi:four helix bundle protein
MYQYAFEKLEIYKLSRALAKTIYNLTTNFPNDERFGIINQIRRASVSVCLNIAEGSSRFSPKEKARFYEISYGSLMEVIACLDISLDLNYMNQEQMNAIKEQIFEISNKLNALRRSC